MLGCFGSLSVLAGTCIGGTIITGKDTNRSFCLSDKTMNWWTAHQWCIGNGRMLAHPDNLCNYNGEGWFVDMSSTRAGCPNLRHDGHWSNSMWTSLSFGDGTALAYKFNHFLGPNSILDRYAAVCE